LGKPGLSARLVAFQGLLVAAMLGVGALAVARLVELIRRS
jgi:hypothetical protein